MVEEKKEKEQEKEKLKEKGNESFVKGRGGGNSLDVLQRRIKCPNAIMSVTIHSEDW